MELSCGRVMILNMHSFHALFIYLFINFMLSFGSECVLCNIVLAWVDKT